MVKIGIKGGEKHPEKLGEMSKKKLRKKTKFNKRTGSNNIRGQGGF